MPTLVLPSRHTDDTQVLWRAAIARGWDIERLHSLWADPGLCRRDPVLYADDLTADAVKDDLGLELVDPPMDFLLRLPGHYVARPVALTTYGAARALTSPTFVKPAGVKAFQAKVYLPNEELDYSFEDDLPVLTAEPVAWHCEYRFFLLDRTPVTGSFYRRDGEPTHLCEAQDAGDYIRRLCDDPRVELPPACVVDVGLIRYVGWAVVEANPAWSSALYDSDPDPVLDVLRRASVPRECPSDGT